MTNLEARIRKLEERYRELLDTTEEANANIEDLYDTVNNIKTPTSSVENQKHENLEKKKMLERFNLADGSKLHEHANNFIDYTESVLPDTPKLEDMLEYFINIPESHQLEILEHLQKHNDIISSNTKGCHMEKPRLITIIESSMSFYHQKMALNKLHMLENMDKTDPEYWKLSQWLDNLLAIPFNKYVTPALSHEPPQEVFARARVLLDSVIHGQKKTKNHMLEIIARMISNPSTQGSIFAVEGLPGCGKTTLIKEGLSQVLGLPFEFISLGGASESAYLVGQNYTYIGSAPGNIIQALKRAQCMNPIFYFDELDKISNTERGQEIMNLLIHLTDPAQNGHFQDLYMDGVPIDLSRAIFVFSFNDRCRVSPILLDRMEVIRFHKYTPNDKAIIIEKYLIPRVMEKYFGTSARDIKCVLQNKVDIFKGLISSRPGKLSTSGIRTIIRKLEKVIARINLRLLESSKCNKTNKKGKKIIILTARMFESRHARFTSRGVPEVRLNS